MTKHTEVDSLKSWIVCISGSLFFFNIFIQMMFLNSVGYDIMRDIRITATQLGTISSCYFYINTAMVFIAGMILDRLSVKKILIISMIIVSISTMVFSYANSFALMCICRLVIGFFGSFCMVSCAKLVSRWFMIRAASAIGVCVTLAMLGGAVAQKPFVTVAQMIGWRSTVMYDAIFGFVLAILISILVKDHPSSFKHSAVHIRSFSEVMKLTYTSVKNIQNWMVGLYVALINLPIFFLGANWGNMYLQHVFRFNIQQASISNTFLFIGSIIGCTVAGHISDIMVSRKKPMIYGAIVSILLIVPLAFSINIGIYSMYILFFLLGFFTSSQIIGYPLIAESNKGILSATSTGIASTLIVGSGILLPVFGWIISKNWNGILINGAPIYAKTGYSTSIYILLAGFIIELIMSILVRETHCKNIVEESKQGI